MWINCVSWAHATRIAFGRISGADVLHPPSAGKGLLDEATARPPPNAAAAERSSTALSVGASGGINGSIELEEAWLRQRAGMSPELLCDSRCSVRCGKAA